MNVSVYYIQNTLSGSVPAQPVVRSEPSADTGGPVAGTVTVETGRRFQTMAGVGAAFSEIGTRALAGLPATQRERLMQNLFDAENGAGFSLCRLPVGASDFATSAYSYAMTPDDVEMKAFSLARDEQSLIPAVRAALAVNPRMKLHASPWSPPGWMKVSGRMEGGDAGSRLRDEEQVYTAYALYFEKYLRGYLAAGIPIARLCPQNEVDMNPKYPGCLLEPWQMVKFVTGYLAPRLKQSKLATELWAGTFREGLEVDYAAECMKDAAFRNSIAGLGIQYFNAERVEALARQYPGVRLMHTEADCANGENTAETARSRLPEIIRTFNAGCDGYAYWNMILDETHKSGWDWSQNSLVIIDRNTGEVRYNPDFQPVCLVSRFVRPGCVRVAASFAEARESGFTTPVSAFTGNTPDGGTTVLLQNRTAEWLRMELVVDATARRVMLPPHADCAVVCTAC